MWTQLTQTKEYSNIIGIFTKKLTANKQQYYKYYY